MCNYEDLQQALTVVQEFRYTVGMQFEIDECAVVYLKTGPTRKNGREGAACRRQSAYIFGC